MYRQMEKVIDLLLAGCLFFPFIIGCSTKPHSLGREIFPQNRELMTRLKEVERFDSIASPKRGDPNYRYLLACYYQEQDKHREAIEEFKKILLVDPGNVKVLNGMGISYDVLGDFPKAIESYKKALKLKDDLDYVHNNQGYSYLLQGNPDEAILCFQRAIALNGRDGRFHNNLGLAYATKGQMDLAMVEFKRAGNESKAHYTIAQFYSRIGSNQEDQRRNVEALTLNLPVTQSRDSLNALESLAKLSQPKSHKAGDKKVNSSSPFPTGEKGESEIKEEMLPVPPWILKSNEEQPSGIETHLARFSMKEPPEIGEMTNKEEEALPLRETGMKRETPAIDHVSWGNKPIGQRALELSNTVSDKEILELLHKEYGKEQLDQWLGISKGKGQMKPEDTY